MLRRACRLLLLVVCVGAVSHAQDRRLPPAAGAQRRVALVVGNDAYSSSPLKNAVADARAISAVLQSELGFAVDLVTDARLETFEARLDRFIGQLQAGDVSLFYYSGHAVEIAGENYLLPTDFVTPPQQAQVKRRSVSAQEIVERMAERGVRIQLVILDACRDNPFRGARTGSGGLTKMDAQGALVAYSTAPGQTASDNPGGTNSLFTRELVAALRQPGLTVPEIFRRVRAKVAGATDNKQFPWVSDGIVGDFVLLPGPRPADAPPTSSIPAAPAGAKIVISVDADATVTVSGQSLGKLSAGAQQLVDVAAGQQLITAVTLGQEITERRELSLAPGVQQVVKLELAEKLLAWKADRARTASTPTPTPGRSATDELEAYLSAGGKARSSTYGTPSIDISGCVLTVTENYYVSSRTTIVVTSTLSLSRVKSSDRFESGGLQLAIHATSSSDVEHARSSGSNRTSSVLLISVRGDFDFKKLDQLMRSAVASCAR